MIINEQRSKEELDDMLWQVTKAVKDAAVEKIDSITTDAEGALKVSLALQAYEAARNHLQTMYDAYFPANKNEQIQS